MATVGQFVQSADWKNEKHVPVIECADTVTDGKLEVTVSVGKEIAHPNTTEHHIAWISLYFKPANDKFIYEVGRYEFSAHGQAVAGANQGPVFSDPKVTTSLKTSQAGTLIAVAYCNIHGLWESSKEVALA
ncbi:MAG: class II SORL domain-containing protein [Anaerolineae bacterium]|jgi:superoxide reductase|nr:Neelaredoxin [Chloroflexota bacterium]